MAKKPQYVELKIVGSAIPSHSLAGYELISDHTGSDGLRHLFLKRPEVQAAPTPKPKVTRKRRAAKTNAGAQALDTSIQPAGVPNNG